ncbi:MAG: LLM class flavin-dependent oxidoreductase [Kutzneria sp.]|nr:LLM class flavin-dependent oxidoreductase [Kutzneria sp.]
MSDTRYGLLLPTALTQLSTSGSARDLIGIAVSAERLGFDSVWVGDSLLRPRIEPLALLSALAAATSRVTLGTAVLLPAYRHPVLAALSIASLDLISAGRVVIGVGGGFPGLSGPEFDLVGVRLKTRFSHLNDAVALWRQLWSGAPKSFHGKVLHYDWLPEVPRPHRDGGPPIWLGGATSAALRRTGRFYDGWLPYPPAVEDYASGLASVRAAAATAGRAEESVTPALYATVHVDDDVERGRRELDRYCRANYRMHLDAVGAVQVMMAGSLDSVAAQLRRYTDAGAQHVLIRVAAIEPETFTSQLSAAAPLLHM